jgi:hypothetical protein
VNQQAFEQRGGSFCPTTEGAGTPVDPSGTTGLNEAFSKVLGKSSRGDNPVASS